MQVAAEEIADTPKLPVVPPSPAPPLLDSSEDGIERNAEADTTGKEPAAAEAASGVWNGEAQPAVLSLEDVIFSVYRSYPKLEAALSDRGIAAGDQLAASGAFDLKIKGETRNQPLGYYETYRHAIGAVQPTMNGGNVYGGYRIGRGVFEPWYKERQTNEGGELKVGAEVPFARNRRIDERRAELLRTAYGRQLVDAEIQAQLIEFVQGASYAWWMWVSAGRNYRIAERVLSLAEERTGRIRRQVEEQLVDPPVLTDNLRLVAERKAKLSETSRKLQQSAIKLSLYLRDAEGRPLVAGPELLPEFPDLLTRSQLDLEASVERALSQRPELVAYELKRQQLQVDQNEAANGLLPAIDGYVTGSQDMGEPTSKKRDKSEFELEAGLLLDVPLQRRKARGKLMAVQAKLAQLAAKQRLMRDAIAADVQSAIAALLAAIEQVEQAREAVELAEELARRERRNFELGASDLLKVTLREQYAAESAMKEVEAQLVFFLALADFRAAVGDDRMELDAMGVPCVPSVPPLCQLPK
ncbi:MAG: TolC family protein [Planctomycetaceae bacterium]|nr:TolC family protein [Planctomycetaceae bacterium]